MTNANRTVTAEYLMGISEGRALLKAWQSEGLADVGELARASLDSLSRLCAQFDAQSPVGQMMRGERDFWRNQAKLARA